MFNFKAQRWNVVKQGVVERLQGQLSRASQLVLDPDAMLIQPSRSTLRVLTNQQLTIHSLASYPRYA
jgi:hypothetical protein